jgi:hypothetical protein
MEALNPLRITLVTLVLVTSCSGNSSVDAMVDADQTDASQDSSSAGDDHVCRCGESALIMPPSVATSVSADTCTVVQNGPGYSAMTTTGDPCIATFTFADGGTATVDLTFTRPVGCCSGHLVLLTPGISWR